MTILIPESARMLYGIICYKTSSLFELLFTDLSTVMNKP